MQTFLKTPILLLLSLSLVTARAADETATVNEGKINVRGQPSLIGEVVTQLKRGDEVTILEYVKNERAKGGEPTNWAKIKLPANTPVWVYAPMIKEGAVAATRLNLRAGAGDNYSVIGRLGKGDKVNQIRTMGDWIEIEAPAGAYAFVDATLLKHGGGSAPASPVPTIASAGPATAPKTQPTPRVSSTEAAPLIPSPTTLPTPATTAPPATSTAAQQDALTRPTQPALTEVAPVTAGTNRFAAVTPATPLAPAIPRDLPKVAPAPAPKTEAPAGKRIVRREGIVRATRSIQAPTWYELVSPETKKAIDYLYEEKLGVKLKEVKGQKVIVSGEEAIDPRWPNTPILEMQTLDIAP